MSDTLNEFGDDAGAAGEDIDRDELLDSLDNLDSKTLKEVLTELEIDNSAMFSDEQMRDAIRNHFDNVDKEAGTLGKDVTHTVNDNKAKAKDKPEKDAPVAPAPPMVDENADADDVEGEPGSITGSDLEVFETHPDYNFGKNELTDANKVVELGKIQAETGKPLYWTNPHNGLRVAWGQPDDYGYEYVNGYAIHMPAENPVNKKRKRNS